MADTGAVKRALEQAGVKVEGEPGEAWLRAADARLREDPRVAKALAAALLPAVAAAKGVEASVGLLCLGGAALATKDATQARDFLVDGLGLLPPSETALAARGGLRLASAESALGNPRGARAALARAFSGVLGSGDPPLLEEAAHALRQFGDSLAAEALDHLRREKRSAGSDRRLEVIGRLTHALNSSIASTSEPLYAILRVVLEEIGAERGFIMLHDGASLRFELGLARDGRALGPQQFAYSSTVVDKALAEGRCVLVPDLAATLPFAQASSAQHLGLGAALCAPLRVDRKRPGAAPGAVTIPSIRGIAGVLYGDATTAGSFGERDVQFFEVLADCAVLAVRAARTSKELEVARAGPKLRPGRRPRGEGSDVAGVRPEDRSDEAPAAAPVHAFDVFRTQDPGMKRTLELVSRVAASEANVLIRGESGTGKELVARAIHRHGPRAKGPFVPVDCGALPDSLVSSELFGNEAGAFTGAATARPGLLERASGGVLFLDEVGEMSPSMQAALLRALQEGEVRRLGGDQVRRVDLRIVAATHRDLRTLVETGQFRHDLLFRLAVVEVKIPPLRERAADIALLVEEILRGSGRTIEPEAVARLEEHGWPGNVRELENVLRSASVAGSGALTLTTVDEALQRSPSLPQAASGGHASGTPSPPGGLPEGTLVEIEKQLIVDRLERTSWNQVQAAKSLGIDRNTLHRKMLRFGIVKGRA